MEAHTSPEELLRLVKEAMYAWTCRRTNEGDSSRRCRITRKLWGYSYDFNRGLLVPDVACRCALTALACPGDRPEPFPRRVGDGPEEEVLFLAKKLDLTPNAVSAFSYGFDYGLNADIKEPPSHWVRDEASRPYWEAGKQALAYAVEQGWVEGGEAIYD